MLEYSIFEQISFNVLAECLAREKFARKVISHALNAGYSKYKKLMFRYVDIYLVLIQSITRNVRFV